MRILPTTQLKQRFATDERGTTAVIFALMAVPMVAIIGLALDFSRANGQTERLQEAVDSAVLAAANAPLNEKASTAQKFFAGNFDTSNGAATSTFSVDTIGNITGVAHSTITMPFASLARLHSTDVSVDASATTDVTSTTTNIVTTTTTVAGNVPCIHVLDPIGNKALWMDSLSSYNAQGCVVNVLSNNSQAMFNVSASNTKFKSIKVKGGATAGSGLTIMDAPNSVQTNQSVEADPFASTVNPIANAINPGACSSANMNKTWTGAVSPGTYCGSTTFNNATFAAGLYIIKSGPNSCDNGGLRFSGMINGNAGVSFYFADSNSTFVSYSGSEGSKLAAPTTGATKGLLFFEKSNRSNSTYALSVAGQSKHSWTGVVYLPTVKLTLDSLSSWNTFNVGMAVFQLKMKSLSSVMTAYSWLPYNASLPVTLASTSTTSTTTVEHNNHHDGYLND
jgi:Flp pilus assembly protein TadG